MITQVQERGLYPLQKSLYHLMPKLPVFASRTTWMIYSKRRDILSINIICPHICLISINLLQGRM